MEWITEVHSVACLFNQEVPVFNKVFDLLSALLALVKEHQGCLNFSAYCPEIGWNEKNKYYLTKIAAVTVKMLL